MSKTWAIISLSIVTVVAAVALLYLYEYSRLAANEPTTHQSVAGLNAQLAQNSPAFATAVQLENQGNYASAIPQLTAALASTNTSSETITIQFHLEQDYEFTGNYQAAVQLLQQIATTNAYSNAVRAYATEEMGVIYANYADTSINSAIFGQQPYESLYVSTSTNLSLRNLFQYATTIYPLPISEYYIAGSYFYTISNTNPGQAKLAQLEGKAKSAFDAGDAAFASLTPNPPTTYYPLRAELVRAIALTRALLAGDTDLGTAVDAEQAFKNLLNDYASQNLTADGAVRLQYAYFIANNYGAPRASDIDMVLAPLYQDPTNRGAFIEPMLKGYASAINSGTKNNLVLVSSIDPQFKTFLISLGWTSADFATSTAGTTAQ